MNKVDSILSDADGTLVDTVELIRRGQYETSKIYLTQHGLQASDIPNYETYTNVLNKVVGGSARHTLENTLLLLYANSPHHLHGVDFDELHSLLNPTQDILAPEVIQPYPHLADTLHKLGQKGIKLAIFTSGTPHHVVRNFSSALPELGTLDLAIGSLDDEHARLEQFKTIFKDYFGLPKFEVVTCNDTQTHKPDPEGLNIAMKLLGTTPEQSLVLGDHRVDIQTGINAGVKKRVGVTHGFDDRKTLEEAGATAIIDSLPEILNLL